jgi:hypothetical protein
MPAPLPFFLDSLYGIFTRTRQWGSPLTQLILKRASREAAMAAFAKS